MSELPYFDITDSDEPDPLPGEAARTDIQEALDALPSDADRRLYLEDLDEHSDDCPLPPGLTISGVPWDY